MILAGGVILAVMLLIFQGRRVRKRKTAAFQEMAASLGLRRAPLEGRLLRTLADHSWLGTRDSTPVILQFCERAQPRPMMQGISGIEIDLATGIAAGGAWQIESRAGRATFVDRPADPSRLSDRQRAALCALQETGRFLLLAGIPFESITRGTRLDLLARSAWPEGWTGLVLCGAVPLNASRAEVERAIADLAAVRKNL